MFQAYKRARYVTQNNFHHWNAKDGVNLYKWLKEHMWPVDSFVDWFMRVHPQINEYTNLSFKLYMSYQFEWVEGDNIKSLNDLYTQVADEKFQAKDKENLTKWLKIMVDGANNR